MKSFEGLLFGCQFFNLILHGDAELDQQILLLRPLQALLQLPNRVECEVVQLGDELFGHFVGHLPEVEVYLLDDGVDFVEHSADDLLQREFQ